MKSQSLVAVVINGRPRSAADSRARGLFDVDNATFAGQATVFFYREPGKLRATFAFLWQLQRAKPKLVYVVDLAAAGVVAAAIYRLMSPRSKLVIDTGDAIAALARKLGQRGRIGLFATTALERLGHRVADRLVVRGSQHKKYLGRHAAKTAVIQDGVNLVEFGSVTAISGSGTFQSDSPLIVGVLGSLDWNSALQWCYGAELIDALNHLSRDLPIRGLIVGDGSGLAHLQGRVKQLGLGNRVQFLGRVPADQLPEVLAQMHIALSTQTNDIVGQVRTTGKLPLYLAAKRFVLASRVGEAALMLPDEMLIDYFGPFDPEYPKHLATALDRLVSNKQLIADLSATGPALCSSLDYSRLAVRLREEVLTPLMS